MLCFNLDDFKLIFTTRNCLQFNLFYKRREKRKSSNLQKEGLMKNSVQPIRIQNIHFKIFQNQSLLCAKQLIMKERICLLQEEETKVTLAILCQCNKALSQSQSQKSLNRFKDQQIYQTSKLLVKLSTMQHQKFKTLTMFLIKRSQQLIIQERIGNNYFLTLQTK